MVKIACALRSSQSPLSGAREAGGSGLEHVAHAAARSAADRSVNMSYDGLVLTPQDYAALLQRITADGTTTEDYYSQGGVVARLAAACAAARARSRRA